MKKWFEAGKNSKELGIDTSRKFVLVERDNGGRPWDIVEINKDDNTTCPFFNNITRWHKRCCYDWHSLAYADEVETKPKRHTYETIKKRSDGVVFKEDSIDGHNIEYMKEEIQELKEKVKKMQSLLKAHRNLFKTK